MKNLISLFFLSTPICVFSQSQSDIDSVNYHFNILLNHDRDSIRLHQRSDLNKVTIETDVTKFINPLEHLDRCVDDLMYTGSYFPHSTTNIENFLEPIVLIIFQASTLTQNKLPMNFSLVGKTHQKVTIML